MTTGGFTQGNSLFSCCAKPGGWGLCCISWCIPCITLGDNNAFWGGPLGWIGGFLAGFLDLICAGVPGCVLTFLAARETVRMKSPNQFALYQNDHTCNHLLKAWCCMSCLMCQVRREQMMTGLPVYQPVAQVVQPAYGAPQGQVPVQAQPMERQGAPVAQGQYVQQV